MRLLFREKALPQLESDQPLNPPPTHMRQLALQCAAAFAVLSLAWPYFLLRNEVLPWPETALAIGGLALLAASLTRQPWWWRLIHAMFAPMAWFIAELSIPPGWFLVAFVVMLLVYRGAITAQVPLYFSNHETANALAGLFKDKADIRFVDLGAGIGSVLYPLALTLPKARLTGIENAPATWLAGRIRTAGLRNCTWRWGDLWRTELAEYNVVYAFLSPAPMSRLWEKVQREMPPGSFFISNSFAVPGVEASSVIDVDDARKTRLYCYQR